MTNIEMDEDLPMIGEIVKADGRFWNVNGINFHVGSKDGDIALRVSEFEIRIGDGKDRNAD